MSLLNNHSKLARLKGQLGFKYSGPNKISPYIATIKLKKAINLKVTDPKLREIYLSDLQACSDLKLKELLSLLNKEGITRVLSKLASSV